ncbi:MAG: VOC family protein [Gammaproteobacteria bacterium]|nr:VOC family protein [Gammaproteobacteria bacterium]
MKQHGVFSWNELMTTDVTAAKAFYSELFGWTLADMNDAGTDYTMAKIGDQPVAGIMLTPPEEKQMPPSWGSYVTVDDVDKRSKQAVALGGSILVEPRDIPTIGRFAVIADPQGAFLSLITYFDQD